MALSVVGGLIVTNDARRRVIKNGVINVEENVIVEVGPASTVKPTGDVKIDATGMVVIPGLICTHDHAYGVITHGMPFPKDWFPMPSFAEAILDWWWPAVEEVLTKDDVRAAVLASAVESLKTGTTTIIDILEAPNTVPGVLEVERKALDPLGIRAILSLEASERINKKNAEESIQENLAFIRKYNSPDARIRGMHCLHTTFSCSVEMIQRVRELANHEKAGIQIHLEEGRYEGWWTHIHHRKTPVELYDSLGFLGSDVLASQAVHPTPKEIDILAKRHVNVSHQPVSNCEGGHGFSPVVDMLSKGLAIGLGSDGVVLDLFEVMRMAHFIHKAAVEDATVMPPQQVFEMATLHGAKCALQEQQLGSLEKGRKADIVVLKPHLPTPLDSYNVIDQLVLYCDGKDVVHTVVDGKVVVENHVVQTVDEEKVKDQMQKVTLDYWQRAMDAMNNILKRRRN
ncbi:MAG: amidohydrolase family protein [Candidatus Ranarchaeia archaeon]